MPLINFSEDKKPLVVKVCLVLITCSLVWLFTRSCSCAPSVGHKPSEALGTVVAEETAKLLQNRGNVVVLAVKNRQVSEVEAFQKKLKKFSGMTIAGQEFLEVSGELPTLPGDKILALINRYPNADAVVSFGGCPAFSPAQMDALPQKLPKMIAVCWSTAGVKKLLDVGIVQMAVLPRMTAPPTQKARTTRQWFDKYFETYTKANAGSLSE